MSFVIIAMALKMMVEARSDFEKKGPSAKIKLHQIGISFSPKHIFFH